MEVDGQPLAVRAAKPGARRHVYIALNKPVGITCTTDTTVKGNIVDFVGHQQRIFPIGRLDKGFEPDPADQQRRHRQRDPAGDHKEKATWSV